MNLFNSKKEEAIELNETQKKFLFVYRIFFSLSVFFGNYIAIHLATNNNHFFNAGDFGTIIVDFFISVIAFFRSKKYIVKYIFKIQDDSVNKNLWSFSSSYKLYFSLFSIILIILSLFFIFHKDNVTLTISNCMDVNSSTNITDNVDIIGNLILSKDKLIYSGKLKGDFFMQDLKKDYNCVFDETSNFSFDCYGSFGFNFSHLTFDGKHKFTRFDTIYVNDGSKIVSSYECRVD